MEFADCSHRFLMHPFSDTLQSDLARTKSPASPSVRLMDVGPSDKEEDRELDLLGSLSTLYKSLNVCALFFSLS